MKNKKMLIIISAIILSILFLIIFLANRDKNTSKNTTTNESSYSIKSTEDSKIEKEGIEAENIEIIKEAGQIKVVTTLKNNSNEDVNSFFVEVILLDKDGKQVTSIAKNSDEKIPANGTITLTNYITGASNMQKIENAKIGILEKR